MLPRSLPAHLVFALLALSALSASACLAQGDDAMPDGAASTHGEALEEVRVVDPCDRRETLPGASAFRSLLVETIAGGGAWEDKMLALGALGYGSGVPEPGNPRGVLRLAAVGQNGKVRFWLAARVPAVKRATLANALSAYSVYPELAPELFGYCQPDGAFVGRSDFNPKKHEGADPVVLYDPQCVGCSPTATRFNIGRVAGTPVE